MNGKSALAILTASLIAMGCATTQDTANHRQPPHMKNEAEKQSIKGEFR